MEEQQLDGIKFGRTRAEILTLVRTRHRAQQSRMDHVELWHMLRGIGLDVGENDVITCLQDLEILQALRFNTDKTRKRNEVSITQIQLMPFGLALVERRAKDESVLF